MVCGIVTAIAYALHVACNMICDDLTSTIEVCEVGSEVAPPSFLAFRLHQDLHSLGKVRKDEAKGSKHGPRCKVQLPYGALLCVPQCSDGAQLPNVRQF